MKNTVVPIRSAKLLLALLSTFVALPLARAQETIFRCDALFAPQATAMNKATPAGHGRTDSTKNSATVVYSTASIRPGETLEEINADEAKLAQAAYREGWLATKAHIDNVKKVLNQEFVGSEDVIDEAVSTFSKVLLDRSQNKTDVKNPTQLMTLIGPTGRGKTAILIRVAELLDLRKEFVTPVEGAVSIPLDSLRRLSDQRSGGLPSLFILDEIQHLRPFRDLKADRQVPIDDDGLVSMDGKPRYRIVNEIEQRQRSYTTLVQALGGGKAARIPLLKPKEYASRLSSLTTFYTEYKRTLTEAKATIANIQSASPDGKDAALVSAQILKDSGNRIEETLNKYAKTLNAIYELIDQAKDDQPDFFTTEAREQVSGVPNIPNLGNLTEVDLVSIYKQNPDDFVAYMQLRASQMPDSPIETYSNLLLGITGNPVEIIQKVEESFYGRIPTPDDLVAAYKQIATGALLKEWLLERFDPNSPALSSRLRTDGLKMILPFTNEQYEELARRQILIQQNEFQARLKIMGILQTTIEFDPSIFAAIRTEAISAFAGSREFFPRVTAIIQPITIEATALVAEMSKSGPVPQKLTVSFDPQTRIIHLTSAGGPKLEFDLNLRNFGEPRVAALNQAERERRARFLASMIVVGMVSNHSLPLTVHLGIDHPGDFEGWDINYREEMHSTAQATIYTALAGVVGNQIGRPGSMIDKWDTQTQMLYLDVLKRVVGDIRVRDKKFTNLVTALPKTDAMLKLPAEEVASISESDFKAEPKILTDSTKMVAKIISSNSELVAMIMDQLLKTDMITPEQVNDILTAYTAKQWKARKWIQNIKNRVGPFGPDRLATTRSIKTQPGTSYSPPDTFHEKPDVVERVRRYFWGTPGWR